MKYTNAGLTRWLQAANVALAENDVECVVTSREGRAEVRTPAGGIVTAWASGKVSAGGPTVPRQDLLSALSAADLIVGFTATLMTGGMLLKMPEVEEASPKINPVQEIEQLRAKSWKCKGDAPDDVQRISAFLAEVHGVCTRHGMTFDTEGASSLVVCDFDFSRSRDDDLLTAIYR